MSKNKAVSPKHYRQKVRTDDQFNPGSHNRLRGSTRLMAVPFIACMALVAQIYALPPRVLPSIQAVEGGRAGLTHRNMNGTDDLGIMQVNTIWLPRLARYTGLALSEVRYRLLSRPCFNIAAGGLILRTYLDEANGDLLTAVGNYHSHTPMLHQDYQARVLRTATRLFQTDRRSGNPG